MVIQGTDIDSTAVVEHTEWVEPEIFRSRIASFISDK